MFIRRFQKRKNGKQHVYWALVETYRTVKGPRQRIVSYLGELKESEQSGWAQLVAKLDSKKSDDSRASGPVQQLLFDPPLHRDEVEEAFGSDPVRVAPKRAAGRSR